MKLHQEQLRFSTRPKSLLNITDALLGVVQRSRVQTGLLTVFVKHTSASLIISENADPAVLRDLERWLSDAVSEQRAYEHCDEGPDDMPAHIRSVLTRTSENIPVSNAKLCLGTWQAVYLWEHRARPHARELCVHIAGID